MRRAFFLGEARVAFYRRRGFSVGYYWALASLPITGLESLRANESAK